MYKRIVFLRPLGLRLIIAGVSGLWNASDIKDILKDNFACAVMPTYTLKGQQVQLKPFTGYKCIGVNSHSKNLAEAQQFALFLNNYDNQVKRFEARGYSPVNKQAIQLDKIKNDPCVKVIQQQLSFSKTQVGVPTTFWSPIESMGKAMVASTQPDGDPFDAQAQLTAAVNAIVKNATPAA